MSYCFEDLTHDEHPNIRAERELNHARISVRRDALKRLSKIPAIVTGELGDFTFERGSYWWTVTGELPLQIAKELYDDPAGRAYIRVAGNADHLPPAPPFVVWKTRHDNRQVLSSEEYMKKRENGSLPDSALNGYEVSDDPAAIGAQGFITYFHLDSEVGLRLFADTLKEHGLA